MADYLEKKFFGMDKIFYLHFCRHQIRSVNLYKSDCEITTITDIPHELLCKILEILVWNARFDDIVLSFCNGNFFQERNFRTYWCPITLVSRQFKDAFLKAKIADIICHRCNVFCNTEHNVCRYWNHLRNLYLKNMKFNWLTGFYNFRICVGLELARNRCQDHQMCDKLSFITNSGLDVCFRVLLNSGCTYRVKEFCRIICNLCDWKPKTDLLFKPAMFGRIDIIRIILDANFCTIEKGGTYALRKAVRYKQYHVINFLLMNGAVPTQKTHKHMIRDHISSVCI